MNRTIQMFKELPTFLRYLICWVCICAPFTLAQSRLPREIYIAAIIAVTAFFLVFFLARTLIEFFEKKQGTQLDKEISEQSSGPSRKELAEKEREYKEKWLEGIDKLRRAKVSIYALPWYIILGEPGGGKTMTLLNSGMDFPMGKDELPGFGGTRNYNWWFTNTAVIMDTAGRLVFEQEGTTDRHEWESFLKLLRRRRRLPINGVIVALPANKLMSDTAEKRYQNACIIRDRLRQIQTILGVRFPVFLLITKSDLVPGFTEFYNELDSLQRNQLFGWSRPGDFAEPYEPADFGRHFGEVYDRLAELRLQFFSRKVGATELGWIYTFPEAFRNLQDRIQDYIDVVFSKNIFAEPLFFRGFYFTSALQEGKPIIDVLGEHLSGEDLENLEGLFPQSRAFFIHDFYTGKVSKEQGMVFRSAKHIKRMRWLRNSSLYVGLPVILAFVVLTFLGYRAYGRTVAGPRQTIAAASQLVEKYKAQQEANGTWTVEGLEDPQGDYATAVRLAQQLDEAVEAVKQPTGLSQLMFTSVGGDAEAHIRSIQRQLIGYCILRPEVQRVEDALSSGDGTIRDLEDFATSLSTYLQWHLGKQGSWEHLRQVLRSVPYLQTNAESVINGFAKHRGTASGGGFAAAMAGDEARQQEVISRAFAKAQDYWLAAANFEADERFKWWAGLVEQCDNVKTSYRKLLDAKRELDRARRPGDFRDAVQRWLANFPMPEGLSTPDAPNTRLLEAVRQHLTRAPISRGRLAVLDELVAESISANEGFWSQCRSALDTTTGGSAEEFTELLARRVRKYQQAYVDKVRTTKNRYEQRLRGFRDLLPYPPQSPTRYEFVESALEAENALREVAHRLLNITARAEPSLEDWTAQLNELTSGTRRSGHFAFNVQRDWRPQDLRALYESAEAAAQRHQLRQTLATIEGFLDPIPEFGLAEFMSEQDGTDRVRTLRFEGLRNRHASSFLLGAARTKRNLTKTLSSLSQAHGPAYDTSQLERLLDDNLGQYVQHYLESWSQAYGEHQLDVVSRFGEPESWEDYRAWIRDNTRELQKEYQDHLEALMTNVIGPFGRKGSPTQRLAAERDELRRHAEQVPWTQDSLLHAVFEDMTRAEARPDLSGIRKTWRRFSNQVADRRQAATGSGKIVFPRLDSEYGLSSEHLTNQLQYIIDYGQWILLSDASRTLLGPHLKTLQDDPPFVFEGGSYDVDPIQLKAALEGIAALSRFSKSQPAKAIHSQLLLGAVQKQQAWLAAALKWKSLLDKDGLGVEITYQAPAGAKTPGPQDFYSHVVLRLPGMTSWESGVRPQAVRQLEFEPARPSQPRSVRWRPEAGYVEVSLSHPTPLARQRGANDIQPRIASEPRSTYGLPQLLLEHGHAVGKDRRVWLVEFTKDLRSIQGLENEPEKDSTRAVAFRIRLLDAPEGLPPVIEPLDPDLFATAKPKPPWGNRGS